MVRVYAKQAEVIDLLKKGWMIFTERGNAPYNPVHFHIYAPKATSNEWRKRVHSSTIQSLINKKIIRDTNRKHGKYTLIHNN